jgi:6-phosphogluconolactonase
MEIEIYNSKTDVAAALSKHLESWCRDEGFRTVALSGGSTPRVWFDLMAARYSQSLPWKELSFYWGDERCVPPEDPESNYGMTRKHLLDHVPVRADHVFRILGEDAPQAEAIRYGRILDDTLPQKNGLPQLDLVILGMGDDGHTASIFPHEGSLWDSPENCVVATHPETGQKRISLTGGVINNAKQVVFLVTGANKASRLKQIHQQTSGHQNLPASRVAPASGRLIWMLDEAAAAELS